jgi:predicted permease
LPDARSLLVPLSAGLLLVLLLACANVGNVQLARGAAGILIAFWLPAEIVRISTGSPTALFLRPDATVLSATVAICVLSCLMAGLAPALQATRRDAIDGLKLESALPGARFSLRTILLAVQVAAVVVLLASAGVMVRSASRAADRALGRGAHGISVVSIQPPVRGYDDARMHAVSVALQQAFEPSISAGSLALTSTPPLASGNTKGAFRLPNAEASSGAEFNAVFEVSPDYFHLMGLSIVDGRGFDPSDAGRPVIVVNQTMANRYWPGRSAVGQRIVCTPPESGWNMPGELEIVGVVQDALMTSFDDVDPAIFQPPTHRGLPQMLTSSPRDADAAAAAVRRLDPALRVRVQRLDDVLAPRLHGAKVAAMIAGALGSLALGFACVGMFGVFAYWVRQRTREIGIRMALGAQSSNVIQLVLGTTAGAVGIGLAVGFGAAVLASGLLRSFLFGLSGVDPATYAAVALLLAASSLAAAFVPARRATRIDPLVALRHEWTFRLKVLPPVFGKITKTRLRSITLAVLAHLVRPPPGTNLYLAQRIMITRSRSLFIAFDVGVLRVRIGGFQPQNSPRVLDDLGHRVFSL